MCRLFGFRSQVPSAVHRSLVRESNALLAQSREHPDGWGIGWWPGENAAPLLERGAGAAHAEPAFVRWANLVSSRAVIAHIRKASVGPVRLANAHPFRWQRWLFAHNGTVPRFEAIRSELEARIDDRFREVIEGDTDSVRCFGLILTHLARHDELERPAIESVARALAETVELVSSIADPGAEEPSATTFLVGNGELMLACRRGRSLYFSTHKRRCIERDSCPGFSARCESASAEADEVSHLILASERISLEDVWQEVPLDAMVGVDETMRLRRFRVDDFIGESRLTG